MQFQRNSEPGALSGVAIGVSVSKSFPLLFHSQMPHAVAFRFLSCSTILQTPPSARIGRFPNAHFPARRIQFP